MMSETENQRPAISRILAIGTMVPNADLAKIQAILPEEARETIALYLDGKIDQWFSLQDRPGVVFLLNVTDLDAAAAALEKLPLGLARMMRFELMPLGPLKPLRHVLGKPDGIS
jgi:hypothetical protein